MTLKTGWYGDGRGTVRNLNRPLKMLRLIQVAITSSLLVACGSNSPSSSEPSAPAARFASEEPGDPNVGTVRLEVREAGKVSLPNGQLAVSDAFINDYPVVVSELPRGDYSVELLVAKSRLDERVAAARVRIRNESIASWRRVGSIVVTATRSTASAVLLGASLFLAPRFAFSAAEGYQRVWIDQAAALHIVTTDGRDIVPQRDAEQVGIDKVVISSDGLAVGWVATYPNCCTSYPIPLKLLVYANGELRTFTGTGLPIWQWQFQASNKHVAFRQETVHGGLGIHYELRDVLSGQLIAEYKPPYDRDNRLLPDRNRPKWVDELNAQ